VTTFLVLGAAIAVAAVIVGATWIKRQSLGVSRRPGGADPYAGQRKPEKLNPGLGDGCASGGGG
jgi:ABC-type uncharacterized transport system permease subunit